MFEDRKIRKALEEEMKPSKSFEQFCLENGLNYVPAAKPAPKKTRKHLKWILPTVAGVIAVLVCGIFLPMFISPVKYYSADAVERLNISQEEFSESEVAAVLDLKGAQTNNVSKVFSKETKKRFLAYELHELVYETTEFSYEMSLVIRVYKGYLFIDYIRFNDPVCEMNENNITILYSIKDQIAYIKFKEGKAEYFITLNGHGATVINEESVESFIRSIL